MLFNLSFLQLLLIQCLAYSTSRAYHMLITLTPNNASKDPNPEPLSLSIQSMHASSIHNPSSFHPLFISTIHLAQSLLLPCSAHALLILSSLSFSLRFPLHPSSSPLLSLTPLPLLQLPNILNKHLPMQQPRKLSLLHHTNIPQPQLRKTLIHQIHRTLNL